MISLRLRDLFLSALVLSLLGCGSSAPTGGPDVGSAEEISGPEFADYVDQLDGSYVEMTGEFRLLSSARITASQLTPAQCSDDYTAANTSWGIEVDDVLIGVIVKDGEETLSGPPNYEEGEIITLTGQVVYDPVETCPSLPQKSGYLEVDVNTLPS